MADEKQGESAPDTSSVEAAAAQLNSILSPPPEKKPEQEAPAEAETAAAEEAEAPESGEQAQPEQAEPEDKPPENKAPDERIIRAEQMAQEAERALAQANAVAAGYSEQLQNLIPQLAQAVAGEFSDIKSHADLLNVASTDPDRYNRFVIKQAQLKEAQAELVLVQQRQRATWLQSEAQRLTKVMPELADPVKGPELKAKLVSFAKQSGYTDQQIANASASDIQMLHRAMRADSIEKMKVTAQQKAAKAPPVQRPGTPNKSGPQDALQADYARLKKTHSIDAAAAVLTRILAP